MPKIKVKNIPSNVVDRLCDCHIHCNGCILHHTTMVNGLEVRCMRDPRIKPSERIIRLSEKDFPTNRQWMESLSDEDLAAFLTTGLLIRSGKYAEFKVTKSLFNIHREDVLDWLSKPCVYLMEEEDNSNEN